MATNKSNLLFNLIAPVYSLFYHRQKEGFTRVIEGVRQQLDLSSFTTILDVGCGTGALCSVLSQMGLSVTGIDPAERMLTIAVKNPENRGVRFLHANALETLPFDDSSFDVAIASYVAHGLKAEERGHMYAEMSRIARHWVIIHDYNDRRSFFTSIIEWLEGGDYFNFIRVAEPEMRDCLSEMKSCFSQVKVVSVAARANWYICKPAAS